MEYTARFFFSLLAFVAVASTSAFEGGTSNNTERWELFTPWSLPSDDSAGISLLANALLSSQDPFDGDWSKQHSKTQRVAPGSTNAFGEAAPALSANIPVSVDGRFLLQWTPRAFVKLGSTWQGAQESLNDSGADAHLQVNGTMNSSSHLEGEWSTLSLGYEILAPNASIALGVQRHAVTLTAAGQSYGDMNATMTERGASGDSTDWETLQAQYNPENFTSTWSGKYQGAGWSASIKAHYGPFHYYGQMGATIKMQGQFSLTQLLPYFLDSTTLTNKSDSLSAWTDPAARDQFSANATTSSAYTTTAPMQFVIPQTHTIGIDFAPWLAIEYTYVAGHYALVAVRDSVESALDFRSNIDHSWNLNHLALVYLHAPWASLTAGGFWMGTTPYPILSMTGTVHAKPMIFQGDLELLPWVRIFCGVTYAL